MTNARRSGPSARAASRAARFCSHAADAAGHLAAALLVVLTVAIVLGIVVRGLGRENTAEYNLSLYSLVWMAFTGAAYTALREHHVTAGIALEKWIGHARAFRAARFVIVCTFLVVLALSGWRQALDAFQSHRATLDLTQWPVWVQQAAVPVGAVLWILAAAAVLLRGKVETGPISSTDVATPI